MRPLEAFKRTNSAEPRRSCPIEELKETIFKITRKMCPLGALYKTNSAEPRKSCPIEELKKTNF
ncbi:hypothetical protein, partial [Ureibacillus sinduriensis]